MLVMVIVHFEKCSGSRQEKARCHPHWRWGMNVNSNDYCGIDDWNDWMAEMIGRLKLQQKGRVSVEYLSC